MPRPNRLYLDSKGKYYYIVDNKRKYIKVPVGMSQKQVQTINIKNVIGGPARKLKRKKKKIVPLYQKKLVPKDDMSKSGITYQSLPTYFFTPQKSFVDLGNITSKTNDTNTDKLIDLLKGIKPVIDSKKIKIEIPEVESKPKFTPMKPEPGKDFKPKFGEKTSRFPEEEFYYPFDDDETFYNEPKFGQRKSRFPDSKPKPEPISPISALSSISDTINLEYEKSKEFIKKSRQPPGREAPEPPKPKDKELIKRLKEIEFNRDKKLIDQLVQYEYLQPSEVSPDFQQTDFWKRIARENVGVEKEYQTKDSIQNAIRRVLREDLKTIGQTLDGEGLGDGDDGLYDQQINEILKKRIKNFVPVVASDKVEDLLEHVEKGDKFFAAVINTEPSSSSGRHWRCIFIDTRDDFPSAEYFDPLAETERGPEKSLISVMRKICKKLNPEKYFKFKYNMLRRQNYNKSNCGFHVMKFIEDRFNGIPFSEASGYDDYMKKQKGTGYEPIDDSMDGEGDLQGYENKIKKQFKSYL